jgi:hypothetical protein
MKKPEKQFVIEKLGELDNWCDLCGSFEDVITTLTSLKEYYDGKYTLGLNEEIYIDYVGEEYEEFKFCIFIKRYETDKEYEKRIKLENGYKDKVKNRELKQYERLKKKYG